MTSVTTSSRPSPPRRAVRALAFGLLSMLLLTAGMCRQAEEPPTPESAATEAAREIAEEAAAEREALEAERARIEAAEEAERQRLAALAEAERELAEREARLAAEREELRRQQALAAERQRLAEREAAAAERERELAEREAELSQREAEAAATGLEPADQAEPGETTAAAEPWKEPWRERRLDPETGEPMPATDSAGPEPAAPESEPAPSVATLQPGKVIEIEVLETLTSRTSQVGDTFSARLVNELRDSAGTLVVPEGSEILGRVTEVTPLKRIGGRATLGVEFTHVVVSPEQTVAINASFLEFGADKRKDKRKIAAGAIVGAILGHVLGGDGSKNVIAGAAAGAAAGTAVVASGKDKDAEIPAGEIIALQLEEVVTVEIRYGPVAER